MTAAAPRQPGILGQLLSAIDGAQAAQAGNTVTVTVPPAQLEPAVHQLAAGPGHRLLRGL